MTRTPGQCAYEAYSTFGARVTTYPPTLWSWLAPVEQAQWAAAALAVLEACVSSARAVPLAKDTPITPAQALEALETVLRTLSRLRAAFHDPLNRADLAEAQACLEDVALRVREDLAAGDTDE